MPTASLKSTYELTVPAQQAIDFFRDAHKVLSLYPTVKSVEEQKGRPGHFTGQWR
jgi:carbon monoxide dehydrogenase subunit G